MGLSYAPDYVWTDHFVERANDRFGIKEEQLPKWISKQINSLTPYDSSEGQIPEKRKYISDSGIIFVCDTIEHRFITCYEANDWIADSKKKILEKLPFNIDNSYSYGDTTGDFTMLQMTGHPTAINPNQKLLDKLKKEGVACNIVVERKDVIYKLNKLEYRIY